MAKLEHTGTFLGMVANTVFNTTRQSGLPQLQVTVDITHEYDGDSDSWVERNEDEQITAYLVLFGNNDQPTINATQVQKVFGWSGKNFMDLQKLDAIGTEVLLRTEERTYNNQTNINVSWIDVADADPLSAGTRTIDDKQVKGLEKKYARILRTLSGNQPSESEAPAKATKATKPGNAKPASSAKKPPGRPKKSNKSTGLTAEEAWAGVLEASGEEDEGVIEDVWNGVIDEQYDGDVDNLTPDDWAEVKTKVIALLTNESENA